MVVVGELVDRGAKQGESAGGTKFAPLSRFPAPKQLAEPLGGVEHEADRLVVIEPVDQHRGLSDISTSTK